MILLFTSLRPGYWGNVSEQAKRKSAKRENQFSGNLRIRYVHTISENGLFVLTEDLRCGDIMGYSLRRIVKRKLVLKTPREYCQRQPEENKGKPG